MKRAIALALLCAGCAGAPDITMPDVRGKSCEHYAAMIAELTGTVERKEMEAQAETAGFFAASVALSLVVPFAGLATIPAEAEAKRDTCGGRRAISGLTGLHSRRAIASPPNSSSTGERHRYE